MRNKILSDNNPSSAFGTFSPHRGEKALEGKCAPRASAIGLSILVALLSLPLSAQTFDDLRFVVVGGKSNTSWHGQADLQALQLELGHSLSPRTTVAIVTGAVNLWQPRSWFGNQYGDGNESVRALSAGLLLRHTFRSQSRLQWYVEAGSGPMIAEKRVPASTSRFNFITHGGAGVVLNANGRVPILAGYRFMHISNGGYAPRNPGLNVSAATIGLQFRSATRRRH